MKDANILIVEDDVIIADGIRDDLLELGYRVPMAACTSYAQAVAALQQECPDLVLLDIRLQGEQTGIDVAAYLNAHCQAPFIFLTSHLSPEIIAAVETVQPAGFITKPYHSQNLWANIELALQRKRKEERHGIVTLIGPKGREDYDIAQLDYMEAEGSYTRYHFGDKGIVQRKTLKEAMEELPVGWIVHVHRSYAVNPRKVTAFTERSLYIQMLEIPISRRRQQEIAAVLST